MFVRFSRNIFWVLRISLRILWFLRMISWLSRTFSSILEVEVDASEEEEEDLVGDGVGERSSCSRSIPLKSSSPVVFVVERVS